MIHQKWTSSTASVDFLVLFPQYFRCANVSVGTNVERTVKSLPNAKSKVGKFLNWFAAALAVSPFPSVLHCLADFALVKLLSGLGSYIFRFFITCRFLTLRDQILYENICLNRHVHLWLKINNINSWSIAWSRMMYTYAIVPSHCHFDL